MAAAIADKAADRKEKRGAGSDAVGPLRKALAATWSFYSLAQSFHWNVTGENFVQLHDFFGQIYRDAQWATDDLAERVRTLGAYAPMSPGEMDRDGGIAFPEGDKPPEARVMVETLAGDNKAVLGALEAARRAAEAANEAGLANYLQGRLDQHKKWGWMLGALLTEANVKDIAKWRPDERLNTLLGKAGEASNEG